MMNTLTSQTESIMKETDPHWDQFNRLERETAATQPGWVWPVRKAKLARFSELGYPTRKMEDWRFTNVDPIARRPFQPVWQLEEGAVSEARLAELPFAGLQAHRLVFLDGHYAPSLSRIGREAEGIIVMPLSQALTDHGELVERHLAQHPGEADNAFACLNSAFFTDGLFLHVSAGKTVKAPVHLVFVATQAGAVAHPRNLIVAGADSAATVLEHFAGSAGGEYFTNAVTELVAGDRAVVEHVRFQDEDPRAFHMAATHAVLGRESRVWSHSMVTGARLSRHNIRTTLDGEGLECVLNGLYLTRDEQLADHHMVVNHAKPHCASHEYFNGILDDRSRGVFHGRILVQQAAQKTDAKQTNKNLLLSDDATANAKPQLEIYADDVKCTHGATVGQLNEESIFYMRARGVSEEMARRMLIHAFAGEIIDRIQDEPIRQEMNRLIWDRLEENEHVAVRQVQA